MMQEIKLLQNKYDLSETEKIGDPQAVALELLNTATTKEDILIKVPRASGLYEACMRMYVLGNRTNAIQTRWTDFNSKVTFGLGTAVHEWCQNSTDIFGDKRRGFWKCIACGNVDRKYFGPYPNTCKCGGKKFLYKEFGVHIKEPVEFTFHADMFIETRGRLRIVEIKTIKSEEFDILIAPLAQHEYQLTVYTIGAYKFKKNLFKDFDHHVGYVLYVSKGHKQRELPVKMFPVKIDSTIRKSIIDKLMLFKRGLIEYPKWLPPCNAKCKPPRFESYVARTCPVKNICQQFYDRNI